MNIPVYTKWKHRRMWRRGLQTCRAVISLGDAVYYFLVSEDPLAMYLIDTMPDVLVYEHRHTTDARDRLRDMTERVALRRAMK